MVSTMAPIVLGGWRYRWGSTPGRWFAPMIVASIGYIAWVLFNQSHYSWRSTDYVATYSLLLVGPLAVLAAFISASREARTEWRELSITTPRWPSPGLIQHWLVVLFWTTGAYLFGLLLSMTWIAINDRGGVSNPLFVLQGLAYLTFLTSLFYAVGYVVKSISAAILVAMAIYVGVGIGSFYGNVVGRFLPIVDGEPTPFYRFAGDVGLAKTLLYFGLAILVLMVLLTAPNRNRRHKIVSRSVIAIALLLAAVSAVWLYTTRESNPAFRPVVGSQPQLCNLVGTVEACVHIEYADLLPPLMRMVGDLVVVLDDLPVNDIRFTNDDRIGGSWDSSDDRLTITYAVRFVDGTFDNVATLRGLLAPLLDAVGCGSAKQAEFAAATISIASGYEATRFDLSLDEMARARQQGEYIRGHGGAAYGTLCG